VLFAVPLPKHGDSTSAKVFSPKRFTIAKQHFRPMLVLNVLNMPGG